MKKVYYLFKVSVERIIKELYRYKFNTISNLTSMYVMFMAMFLGVKSFGISFGASPINLGNNLEGFIVGYFLWSIMLMAYSEAAYSIVNDSNRGTLEQLNMSNISLATIITVRSFASILINLAMSIILLLIIMVTTKYWIEIKIMSILIPILLGIFSILGIGLIFGGLALIFKKVQSLLNMVQFLLIGVVMVRPKSQFINNIMPFRPAADKVFNSMLGGTSLADISLYDYGIMIGNSIIYFSIGIITFKYCVRVAKKKGLLGQY